MTTRKHGSLEDSKESGTTSPERKRTRLDPTIADHLGIAVSVDNKSYKAQPWNYLNSDMAAMADIGVGHLEDSDAEEALVKIKDAADLAREEKENCLALMLQSTISKDTLTKISHGQWNELLIRKPTREHIFQINHFQYLSDEVILQIFWWLPKSCLSNVALVCKRFHRLAQDESLWTRLDLSHRTLGPSALGHILSRQILFLRLSNAEVASPIVAPNIFANFKDFRARVLYLDLSMAHISIDDLALLLSKCYRLKKLSLERCSLDERVLKGVAGNKELEVLNLSMTEGLKIDGLRHLVEGCRKLKELNIGWTDLSEASIGFLCSNFPSTIDRINLAGCRKFIKNENVLDLIISCPNLRELDLSDCTGLTADVINHIVKLKLLNFLALSRCYFIPYQALFELKKIDSLMYLDLHGGYIESFELEGLKNTLGMNVQLNKFMFSSVARPTVGPRRSSIWGFRVRD